MGKNAELGKGVGETGVSPFAESSERSECSEPMGSQHKIPRRLLRGILLITMRNFLKRAKFWLIGLGATTMTFAFAVAAKAQGTTVSTTSSSTFGDWVAGGISSAITKYIISPIVGILGQAALILIDFLIKVVSYTNFMSSPAVDTGWIVVRDIANMFFVAMFLVIAIGTIVNPGRFQGMRAIVRLLLYAIFVNFSKTIAGLCIDASNIVMLTFVNGFKAAAGGNFVDALGMRALVQLNPTGSVSLTSVIGAQILSLIMMVIIVILIGIILIAMVMRMVTLWFLIILSPLAFAMGGSEMTKSRYAEWWKHFEAQLTTGPIVAFFLWLTLVVVQQNPVDNNNLSAAPDLAGGGVSKTQSAGAGTTITCGANNFCQESVIIRFVIAAMMLLGGLMFAKEFEGVGGELAGAAWSRGKGYVNWAGKKALKYGAIGLGVAATGGALGVGIGVGTGTMIGGAGMIVGRSKSFRDNAGKAMTYIPGLRGMGARMRSGVAEERNAKLKKQEELAQYIPLEQKAKRLYSVKKDAAGNVISASKDASVSETVALATGKSLLSDKKFQANASPAEKQLVMQIVTEGANKFNDRAGKDRVAEVERLNPDLIPADKEAEDSKRYGSRQEEVLKNLNAGDYLKMSPDAFRSEAVVAAMSPEAIARVDKDGSVAAKDELGRTLASFATPASAHHDEYIENIKTGERRTDSIMKVELSNPEVLAAVLDKPSTDKGREGLFSDRTYKRAAYDSAETDLEAKRKTSGGGLTYDEVTKRVAEAAVIYNYDDPKNPKRTKDPNRGLKTAYGYDGTTFESPVAQKALEDSVGGNNMAPIVFSFEPGQIKNGTQLAESLGKVLDVSRFKALDRAAAGENKKEAVLKAIIQAMKDSGKHATELRDLVDEKATAHLTKGIV
jgi:hypothetical protein